MTTNTRKITIIDRNWAYAIETPDYYDAEAVTEADAQQDGQIRTLRASDIEAYAVVDSDDVVVDTWIGTEDAGHPSVQAEGARRTSAGQRWVSVDGPCKVGDHLTIDEDGAGTVTDLLGLGMAQLVDALLDDGSVTYYDDATSSYWRVYEDDVVELGRRVAAQQHLHPSDRVELYSLWCAETSAEELGDSRAPSK